MCFAVCRSPRSRGRCSRPRRGAEGPGLGTAPPGEGQGCGQRCSGARGAGWGRSGDLGERDGAGARRGWSLPLPRGSALCELLCRDAQRRGREDGRVDPAELPPAPPGSRGRAVTSHDESSGPRLIPFLLIKMINKSRGKILGVLALFLVMVWYSIYREDSFYFPVQENNKTMCPLGEVEKKAAQLIGNYTRDHPLFLQLKDYFWVKTPSLYELPYGTKGSEDVLLRLLSITHYSLPESIQSLKCRRCAVVGNGHRLRNSSMGDTINTYDVVIRLNNAPVHGYEQDVGSKTTMRLFYPESAHFDPQTENNPDTLLVLVPFKPMDVQWMEAILNDKKRVRKGFWKQPPLIWDANPEQVRILNPYYMEVTAAKLLNLPMKQPRKVKQKPTTGLLAITLALHFCDLVHIAGFGYPDSANKKQTIHYYEQITLKSMAASEHNVSHEAVAIKRMLELGLVRNLTYF
ncbi:CMP-N-acetylneuraminate-beta-galactosamide-alpha-2,3-sialyltransferase 4 isoform X2 [Serinus canaria]|uniref:CMP-N-acetylneuraminate-beta-galactosamide- alpha-2,3-sialyltransferase 4 isoform X2 n=1 Tax=Serinus canaria TaxID=9135 RepID=UPI0021CCAABB|nr:CMP-N-acetylneuraminate-beta-galactosamide-alpha-2,3-sialyltransferase 4 isoform X2 [Serinus canaria]